MLEVDNYKLDFSSLSTFFCQAECRGTREPKLNMSIDKNGFEPCEICGRKYHISDPETFEFDNKKVICNECFIVVFDSMKSWGAKREERVIFDYKKVSIPHSLKWAVWKRDDFTCKHCGVQEDLSVDHIHPESQGGTLEIENLQTLCKSCNSIKSSKII